MSRLLVDTHALLWWLGDDTALSPTARELLADPESRPLVSSVTLWEIAIKRSLGKLLVPDDLPDQISEQGFAWLAISPAHAWKVRQLPYHHRDPFDRLLLAQALEERLPVLSADARFADYGVAVWW